MKKRSLKNKVDLNKLPKHIAIIMDGNGRWAKKRALSRFKGHQAGLKALGKVIELIIKYQIPNLTVFAFSTENWQRPRAEVDYIMNQVVEQGSTYLQALNKYNISLRVIGEKDPLSVDVLDMINRVTEETKTNDGLNLNIAFNYGSHQELIHLVKTISQDVQSAKITIDEIGKKTIESHLYTSGLPEVDLLIRTSGEMRISNFLLWQIAYAEIYFTDTLWPDFNEVELLKALEAYQKRNRRFGRIEEE